MSLGQLLENNRSWARGMLATDPGCFARLAPGEEARHRRLCELNVEEQVRNISECTAVQEAWERGQPPEVHGWIYDLKDGLLRDLQVTQSGSNA
jgi:carbonic anhydrase